MKKLISSLFLVYLFSGVLFAQQQDTLKQGILAKFGFTKEVGDNHMGVGFIVSDSIYAGKDGLWLRLRDITTEKKGCPCIIRTTNDQYFVSLSCSLTRDGKFREMSVEDIIKMSDDFLLGGENTWANSDGFNAYPKLTVFKCYIR
jgi:hypothetical protein